MNAKIAFILLASIVFGDILTSVGSSLDWSYWNFGILIKVPIELYLIVYALKFIKASPVVVIATAIILFTVWLINNIFFFTFPSFLFAQPLKDDSLEGIYTFMGSMTIFSRYIFFFVLSLLMYLYADDVGFAKNVKRLFEYFMILNSVCVILGAVFNISLFSSYNPGNKFEDFERFGYKGLLIGINEVTGVYFLGVSHYYREVLLYKKNNKILLLILVITAAVLTGTKASLLVVLLLTAFYLYKYFRKIFFIIFLPAITISIFLLVTTYFYLLNDLLSTITQSDSLLFAITSGRSYRLALFFEFIGKSWFLPSYILGQPQMYSEMDLLDLYFFFGIASVLYLIIYIKIFLKYEQTADKVPIFVLLLLVASLSGHIIQSAVVPVFLIFYLISSKNTYSTRTIIT